jgi:hypothetical protein
MPARGAAADPPRWLDGRWTEEDVMGTVRESDMRMRNEVRPAALSETEQLAIIRRVAQAEIDRLVERVLEAIEDAKEAA